MASPPVRIAALGALTAIACTTATASGADSSSSSRARAITAGDGHTCAVTSAGAARCWGRNSFGELGNGTTTRSTSPVAVLRLAGGVVAISAGVYHTCAVTRSGAAWCWGYNRLGQLGDGSATNRLSPVAVSGLGSTVVMLAAGRAHTCALTNAGGVKCWGGNGFGQLGDGTTNPSSTPIDVSGLAGGVIAISAGLFHTCALTSAGAVKCWGDNGFGELGDGTETYRLTPVDVSGLTSSVVAISVRGGHSCALIKAGGVKCWGQNDTGELGDGTTTDRSTPVEVSGLRGGVAAISAGGFHTCAVTSSGRAKCWGFGRVGQLGDGSTRNRLTPVDVSGLGAGVAMLAAASDHTCALASSGHVKCWGGNRFGQLGDGTRAQHRRPVPVVGLGGSLKCIVPYVIGKALTDAKVSIARAHCRVGRVTPVASRKPKGMVIRQRPGVRTVLKNGAKVSLEVAL